MFNKVLWARFIVFETVGNKDTFATKLPQFGGLFLIHFNDTFVDFLILLGNFLQDFFGSLTSELWHFTFWVFLGVSGTHQSAFFLRFSKVFTCIQFKNKLISPIFSNIFWLNFTNNPCKTTTGIPSEKIREFHSCYAHIKCLWNLCKT